MRILVTGGIGNVGRTLVAQLVQHGHQVKVIASDVLVRPGPRMAEAARALLALIHPEIQLKAGAGKRP